MRQFKTIFKFEYFNYIKNKGFIIFTIFLLVLSAVLTSIPLISDTVGSITSSFSKAEEPGEGGVTSGSEQKIAVIVDPDGVYSDDILSAYFGQFSWVHQASLTGISEDIENGDVEMAIFIDGLTYTIYEKGSNMLFGNTQSTLTSMIKTVYQMSLLEEKGFSPEESSAFLNMNPVGEVISVGKDLTQTYWISYAVIILMYTVTLTYGGLVLTSVVTEKSSKAMELLITSAKPFQLMLGKVIGVGAAGLTQFGLLMLTTLVLLKLNYASWLEFSPTVAAILDLSISSNVLIYAIIFFLLGFFTFSFVYAAMGSTVSRMEDANSATMLPVLLFVSVYILAMTGMQTPEAFYIKALSFAPFLSPMLIFMRISTTEVPFWQIILSIGLNISYILLLAFVCSRIYKVGVMLYGKKPNFIEIIKYIKKA